MTHSIPPPVRDELFPLAEKDSQATWREHGYTFIKLGRLRQLYDSYAALSGKPILSMYDFDSMLQFVSYLDLECVRLGLTKELQGDPLSLKQIKGPKL